MKQIISGLFLVITCISAVSCGSDSGATVTHTLAVPASADIVTALGENTTYGMVPGLELSGITLPPCTQEDGSDVDFSVTYTLTGADWLSLDSSTRALSLADGATTIPADANTAATVTYTCTDASATSADISAPEAKMATAADPASIEFTVNDADGGGVIDADEYANGAVPLVALWGLFDLTPENLNLYRVGTSEFRIPTTIVKATAGMSAIDATDDTADFDGDTGVTGGGANNEEIANGTNPFVYVSSAEFADSGENPSMAAGANPFGVAVADFDGDGDLDLAAADFDIGAKAYVYLGQGDGTFDSGSTVTTDTGPAAVNAADYDNDGNMDIAVTNSGLSGDGNTLTILLGNGDGTFTDSGENPSTGTDPRGIVAGNFDGDGNIDLAAGNFGMGTGNTLSILLGDGDGTFTSSGTPTVGTGPGGIAAADLDGDGNADLAVANMFSNDISILLGDGDGTFASGTAITGLSSPASIAAADFNGDGKLDLAETNYNGENLSVSINQ